MTTLEVVVCIRVGVSGGYSVCATSACKDLGRADIPVMPVTASGAIERR